MLNRGGCHGGQWGGRKANHVQANWGERAAAGQDAVTGRRVFTACQAVCTWPLGVDFGDRGG